MVYHPGRILKVFKDAVGKNAQATVEFWDENIHTLKIDAKIADKVKEDSFVLVDYYPTKTQPYRPNFIIVNVLEDKEANEIWKQYKDLLVKRRTSKPKQGQRMNAPPQNMNIQPSPEHTYFG